MTKDWDQTYWSDGENTITIKEVLSMLHNHPIVLLPLSNLSNIPSTEIDPIRASQKTKSN